MIPHRSEPASAHGSLRVRLTVVIVNYRTPLLVNECAACLKAWPAQDVTMRIVVVDNDSRDGSPAIIQAAHPDITVIEAGGNLGFARANNLALRTLDSGYALLINSDALVDPGTLNGMIEALESDDTIGVVGPRVVNVEDGADQDYPHRFPTVIEMVRRAARGPQYPARDQRGPVEIERIHGACLMTRASVLHQVGLLDEDFFMYDEDVDWCVRVRQAGWRLLLLPDIRVRHYGGKSSGRRPSGRRAGAPPSETSLRMRYELRRSRYRLYRKHRGTLETVLLKLLTDAALLLDSALWLARALLSPERGATERRTGVAAVVHWNARIIRINPFAIDVRR
jgi:hypothetical protein